MADQYRRGRFSIAEDHEVRAKYGQVPIERLARKLRRKVTSIESRAHRLFDGLKIAEGTPWFEEEVLRLRGSLGVATPAQLTLTFRRTETDIEAAITRLRDAATSKVPLTADEIAEFKLIYGTRSDEDLAAIFGRKLSLIVAMAELLRLSKDKEFTRTEGGKTKMPRWDRESITKLEHHYPTMSNYDIAQLLKRSVKSVVSKAHSLRLKKTPERLRQMGRDNVAKRYKQ
jgi:hypothetical protein